MPSRSTRLAALTFAAAGLAASAMFWHSTPVAAAGGVDPATPEFYTASVQPIFQNNCYRCHGGVNHRGGLKLDSKAAILAGGKDGPVITPGDPAKSLLVTLIRHEGPADDPRPMPPKDKLSDADIATVTAWIKAGAAMPADPPAAP